MRVAHTFDQHSNAHDPQTMRLLTPIAKYWICKRGSVFAQESMERLGGNGYVEEGGQGIMARIYREMPLNSVWEGAENIMALDLLRALRQGDMAAALARELTPAIGAHAALDAIAARLNGGLETMASPANARRLTQDLALAVQAALRYQSAPIVVFRAFCDSRLCSNWGHCFGTLDPRIDFGAIIERAQPRLSSPV